MLGLPAILVALLALAVVATIVAVAAHKRHERSRSESFRRLAGELGLEYREKADREFRDAWTALPQIPKKGDVHHLMYGEIDEHPVTLFRHRYVISTGQGTNVIVHWVLSTEVPAWPELHIKRRGAVRAILGGRSDVSEDERFNRQWSVRTDDPQFARALLNARVRELLERPRRASRRRGRETWHVIGAKLCCVVRGSRDADDLRHDAARLLKMRSAISGEQVSTTRRRQFIGSDA